MFHRVLGIPDSDISHLGHCFGTSETKSLCRVLRPVRFQRGRWEEGHSHAHHNEHSTVTEPQDNHSTDHDHKNNHHVLAARDNHHHSHNHKHSNCNITHIRKHFVLLFEDSSGEGLCEQQSDKGLAILKDRGVPHTQSSKRVWITYGNVRDSAMQNSVYLWRIARFLWEIKRFNE